MSHCSLQAGTVEGPKRAHADLFIAGTTHRHKHFYAIFVLVPPVLSQILKMSCGVEARNSHCACLEAAKSAGYRIYESKYWYTT